jgi:F-type H+-transporting ATPase subunit gamma
VGGRIAERLRYEGFKLDAVVELPASAANITEAAHGLVAHMEGWREVDIGRVLLAHNRRARKRPSLPTMQELLPLRRAWLKELRDTPWPARGLPSFPGPARPLFAGLLRQHLLVTLFRAIAESLASEHASRLASMEAAESNIEEHLAELQSGYRRSRQNSITEELMDIVAGYVSVGEADGVD